jgi:hypothetical protein
MLTPVGVMQQIGRAIRKFLWQGGKSKSKKYHLINWSTIRAPSEQGGIDIKDPQIMN